MSYRGGTSHTAKIRNRMYVTNVSMNSSNGSYTAKVNNHTYKMKASSSLNASKAALTKLSESQNVPNQQLTPEQAAQKGIHAMLAKREKGFVRPNNDNATIIAAENALQYSQARNEQQAENDESTNARNAKLREQAAINAHASSNKRNKEEYPTQAYLIAGHGNEMQKGKFKVPKGCTIVVHKHAYETAYGDSFNVAVSDITRLQNEVITNPVENSYEIINALGSASIFQEGQECPNFQYQTILCFPSDTHTMCYGRNGSGINDLIKMKEEFEGDFITQTRYKDIRISELEITNNVLKGLDEDGVIDLISHLYRFSVYPTKDEISKHIHDSYIWIRNYDWISDLYRYRNPNLPVPEITSINGYQRDLMERILKSLSYEKFINPTQEDLCKKLPGVYYNFVCRSTLGTNNIEEYNKRVGKSQLTRNTMLQPKPKLNRHTAMNATQYEVPINDDYDVAAETLMPYNRKNAIRKSVRPIELLKNRILEGELQRKKHFKNFYTNPKYVLDRKQKLKRMRNIYLKNIKMHEDQGEEMSATLKKWYENQINEMKFINNFAIPSNHTGLTYKKVKNGKKTKWVVNNGTRKKK